MNEAPIEARIVVGGMRQLAPQLAAPVKLEIVQAVQFIHAHLDLIDMGDLIQQCPEFNQ